MVEKYSKNIQGYDLCRVIVLMEKTDATDLYLVYDKYEKDRYGYPFNPFYAYREKINSIPFYKYVVEESEVIDPSATGKRFYSTQLFSYKENELVKNKTSNDGWKVYTTRKAIQDPRTFQNFNWRLLSKITYDFSNVKNVYSDVERPNLKVGVLYSGAAADAKNAFIFANMEESIFNEQNFIFENPLATSSVDKSQKEYWLVNVDDENIDYSNFDLFVWTPINQITEQQAAMVTRILDKNISVFVDASRIATLSTTGLNYLSVDMSVTNSNSGKLIIDDGYVKGRTNMNAWDLAEYSEDDTTPRYSVFGKRKELLNNDQLISMQVFSGLPSTESSSIPLVKLGSNTVIIKRTHNKLNMFSSSLIVSASPLLYLLNNIISAVGVETDNNGTVNNFPTGVPGSQTNTVSPLVIGPNKLFYNILADINRNKVLNYASKNTTANSNVLWNISPWQNSWVINGEISDGEITVLSEDEKKQYNFSFKKELSGSDSFFCRQVIPSITEQLMKDFETTIHGGDAENIINSDFSNVEFYLECTNGNVDFLNFENINSKLSSGEKILLGNTNSSYRIFELKSGAKEYLKSSPLALEARSLINSVEFDFNQVNYPYIITGALEYQDRSGAIVKPSKDYLPGSQDVKDYRFDFKTSITINEITKTVNTYKINWTTNFNSVLSGTADFRNVMIVPAVNQSGMTETQFSIGDVEEKPVYIYKPYSPFHGYYYPSKIFSRTDIQGADQDDTSLALNNFIYTGDISEGNRWDEYRLNYSLKTVVETIGANGTVSAKSVSTTSSTSGSTQIQRHGFGGGGSSSRRARLVQPSFFVQESTSPITTSETGNYYWDSTNRTWREFPGNFPGTEWYWSNDDQKLILRVIEGYNLVLKYAREDKRGIPSWVVRYPGTGAVEQYYYRVIPNSKGDETKDWWLEWSDPLPDQAYPDFDFAKKSRPAQPVTPGTVPPTDKIYKSPYDAAKDRGYDWGEWEIQAGSAGGADGRTGTWIIHPTKRPIKPEFNVQKVKAFKKKRKLNKNDLSIFMGHQYWTSKENNRGTAVTSNSELLKIMGTIHTNYYDFLRGPMRGRDGYPSMGYAEDSPTRHTYFINAKF